MCAKEGSKSFSMYKVISLVICSTHGQVALSQNEKMEDEAVLIISNSED